MKSDEASHTALVVSLMRATHSTYEKDPLIRELDTFQFLTGSEKTALITRLRPTVGDERPSPPNCDRDDETTLAALLRSHPAYGNIIFRTRYAEDRLHRALKEDFSQVVILGAGMDTFCFRHPDLASEVTIFEVDHPATQEMKKQRLEQAGLRPPRNVQYVPVDFERRDLRDALLESGYKHDRKGFFCCLGLTPYLTARAHHRLLRCVAESGCANSELVLNYVDASIRSGVSLDGRNVTGRSPLAEPILSRLMPQELRAVLVGLGFEVIEDVGAEELTKRYYRTQHELQPMANFRMIHARIRQTPHASQKW